MAYSKYDIPLSLAVLSLTLSSCNQKLKFLVNEKDRKVAGYLSTGNFDLIDQVQLRVLTQSYRPDA